MRHLRAPTTVAVTAAFAVIATGALATEASNDDLWQLDEVEAEAVPVTDEMWVAGTSDLNEVDTTDNGDVDSDASDASRDSRASKASKDSKASPPSHASADSAD